MPDSSPSPHFAALGIAFTAGTGLPQVRRMGAFKGEHGGWNRDSLNGYQVIFVPFEYCKPAGITLDVVTGFVNADKRARGQLTGLVIAVYSGLHIVDDAGSTVLGVTGSGAGSHMGSPTLIP